MLTDHHGVLTVLMNGKATGRWDDGTAHATQSRLVFLSALKIEFQEFPRCKVMPPNPNRDAAPASIHEPIGSMTNPGELSTETQSASPFSPFRKDFGLNSAQLAPSILQW